MKGISIVFSLVHSSKLIVKMMENRLVSRLPELDAANKGAITKGHSIPKLFPGSANGQDDAWKGS